MMAVARYHVPRGQRAPAQRHYAAEQARWLACVQEAQRTRADLAISVAIDGLALVDSRSVEHAAHEVSVRDGRAVACTCWPARRGQPCCHMAFTAVRLWELDQDVDLSAVGARALVPTLLNAYLSPVPARRRPWGAQYDGTNDPERRLEP